MDLFLFPLFLHIAYGFPCFHTGISRIIRTSPHGHQREPRKSITNYIPVVHRNSFIDMDEDEDEDLEGPKIPTDMRYTPPNIMRQHQNFVAIREAGGSTVTHDVYCRDPSSSTFWFCGKVASITDIPVRTAVSRQWPLIEEHAVRLRPMELFPKRGLLEIWCAPGDSELDVAYNRPSIRFERITRPSNYDKEWMKTKTTVIGFQGEIYNKNEEGFRTLRNDDGTPMKAEIRPSTEKRAPTDEEMEKISEIMKGNNLQELFKQSPNNQT
jgi:hypothetical protein